MSKSARLIGNEPCSVVLVNREDPYACRNRFVEASRAGKSVDVYEMPIWEVDYLRLLFPNALWSWVNEIDKLAALKPEVVVLSSNTSSLNEFTFSEWTPSILVYLSDECGRTPYVHRHTSKVPLVLRQYHHSHYVRATNVRQIPLGFMNGVLDDPLATPDAPLATERQYRWSFVGAMKGDRTEALRAFEGWGPYFHNPCPPHELARAYQNSKFVLCPRGNVVMDCFRNYEATICGAIPVVAGCSKREFLESFAQLGSPPWVHARTWQRARMICADLEKTGAIDGLQQACIQWWGDQVLAAQHTIADVLNRSSKQEVLATWSDAPVSAVQRWRLRSHARHDTGLRGFLARALVSIVG